MLSNFKYVKRMKTSKQIKSFILKNGNTLTNEEMVNKLKVPTMTFAGVLAAMKRKNEIPNGFLKTDSIKSEKKSLTVKINSVATIDSSSIEKNLLRKIEKNNESLISGRRFYSNLAIKNVLRNEKDLSNKMVIKTKNLDGILDMCDYLEII